MKGSLMVLGMFVAGCVVGRCWGPAEQTLGDLADTGPLPEQ